MTTKARKAFCYAYIGLFIAYFGVIGAYYVLQTTAMYHLWELMIIISGFLSLLFLLSVTEDAIHNSYWILSVIFAASGMVTTMQIHFENILADYSIIGFLANDYLAWGVFFGLAYYCASLTIDKSHRKRKSIRVLLKLIGSMCFLGLLGPITHIDWLWFIAVAGYGPMALVLDVIQLKYLQSLN